MSERFEDYRPNDQDEKLGAPPWQGRDPAVLAWERAHGHDVRLPCHAEDGCLVALVLIETERDDARAELAALRAEVENLCDALVRDGGTYFEDRSGGGYISADSIPLIAAILRETPPGDLTQE